MNADTLDYVDPGTAFSVAGLLYLLLAILAGTHVVLNKQNEASAFSWLGIIVLAPLMGALLYWLFGINRIRRRARAELNDHTHTATVGASAHPAINPAHASDIPDSWQSLMRLGLGVHKSSYLPGNHLQPLINGDEAYPVMIQAIDQAEHSIVMSSYIFEHDEAGLMFLNALIAAHQRGVAVRVLIDGLGVGYGLSLVRADRVLRREGVRTARFLAALSTTGTRFINLRNHRKILSIDGKVAFVGGMNIRQGNLLNKAADGRRKHLTQDVHFKVSGPVIDQINAVFSADWQFAASEQLDLPLWQGDSATGSVCSRVLLDGPDDNYLKLNLTMLGAIQAARHRVQIVTPYFLPGPTVLSALHLACLRGVQVDLCIPQRNNLPFVGWAMRANHHKLLSYGVNIHESAPPFDHSKLFLVDDFWSMIGSSNWDARSLELNFEINLECYSTTLNEQIAQVIAGKLATARQITSPDEGSLFKRLRNNFFRLFSPYL